MSVLPYVLVEVGLLHVAQRQPSRSPANNPRGQIVPRAVGQEMVGGMAPLEAKRMLRLPGGVDGQFVHAAMPPRGFLLQVEIQFGGGEHRE